MRSPFLVFFLLVWSGASESVEAEALTPLREALTPLAFLELKTSVSAMGMSRLASRFGAGLCPAGQTCCVGSQSKQLMACGLGSAGSICCSQLPVDACCPAGTTCAMGSDGKATCNSTPAPFNVDAATQFRQILPGVASSPSAPAAATATTTAATMGISFDSQLPPSLPLSMLAPTAPDHALEATANLLQHLQQTLAAQNMATGGAGSTSLTAPAPVAAGAPAAASLPVAAAVGAPQASVPAPAQLGDAAAAAAAAAAPSSTTAAQLEAAKQLLLQALQKAQPQQATAAAPAAPSAAAPAAAPSLPSLAALSGLPTADASAASAVPSVDSSKQALLDAQRTLMLQALQDRVAKQASAPATSMSFRETATQQVDAKSTAQAALLQRIAQLLDSKQQSTAAATATPAANLPFKDPLQKALYSAISSDEAILNEAQRAPDPTAILHQQVAAVPPAGQATESEGMLSSIEQQEKLALEEEQHRVQAAQNKLKEAEIMAAQYLLGHDAGDDDHSSHAKSAADNARFRERRQTSRHTRLSRSRSAASAAAAVGDDNEGEDEDDAAQDERDRLEDEREAREAEEWRAVSAKKKKKDQQTQEAAPQRSRRHSNRAHAQSSGVSDNRVDMDEGGDEN